MKIETYECKTVVVTSSTLDVIAIKPDLWVFSKSATSKKQKSEGTFTQHFKNNKFNDQGFIDAKNYALLKSGKPYRTLPYCVMSKQIQEEVRKKGWNYLVEISQDKKNPFDTTRPFDAVKDLKSIDPNTIVRIDGGSHMLFDSNNDPLPVGIHFDYISHGGITDGRYDIPKLAKYLLKRKDIVVYAVDEVRGDSFNYDKVATTVEEAIMDVPYYNRERGCTKTINFLWQPSKSDYRKMWQKCLTTKKDYPSTCMHQAIFDLDLLGVRKAKIALFDNYYESTRYKTEDEDLI